MPEPTQPKFPSQTPQHTQPIRPLRAAERPRQESYGERVEDIGAGHGVSYAAERVARCHGERSCKLFTSASRRCVDCSRSPAVRSRRRNQRIRRAGRGTAHRATTSPRVTGRSINRDLSANRYSPLTEITAGERREPRHRAGPISSAATRPPCRSSSAASCTCRAATASSRSTATPARMVWAVRAARTAAPPRERRGAACAAGAGGRRRRRTDGVDARCELLGRRRHARRRASCS